MSRRPASSVFLTLCLLLWVAGCGSTPSTAEPRLIGHVVAAVGSPQVVRSSQSYIVDARSLLYAGDIIQTNEASRVRVRMLDELDMVIGPRAHIIFHSYPDRGTGRMTLTGGSVLVDIDAATPARKVEVQTPVATITARAGSFIGGFLFAPNILDVALLSGQRLDVGNKHGRVTTDVIDTGTTVIGGSGPQPPQPWSPRKLRDARDQTLMTTPGET